jgi:mannose-6-phosphate isomerase
MYLLKGKVKHYDWGGTAFIPRLLGEKNTELKPFAEYWLGVHPGGPSRVRLSDNADTGLPELIRSEPARYLGQHIREEFGDLPFLLKVLDVQDMLSIQVHPTRSEAEKGYAREDAAGIPLDAPNRNYKDRNHKPEIMVALGEFWLLHGFAPDLAARLETNDYLGDLLPLLETRGLKGLYQYVMELPQDGVDKLLKPLAEQIIPRYATGQLSKSSPDFWAARALIRSGNMYTSIDRGIFSIYFFNILHLHAGEGIFQGAGVPHAYLEGRNIELMSNSDNVLRAGLTPKHIDVPELLAQTRFEFTEPVIMQGEQNGNLTTYSCPVPDFILYRVTGDAGKTLELKAKGPEIWIMLEGMADWRGILQVESRKGDAIFVLPGEQVSIQCREHATFFRAAVPY